MNTIMEFLTKFLLVIVTALFINVIVSWAAMLLWNDVMVTYFSLPPINFWHMFEILILTDLLFKKNINVNKQ